MQYISAENILEIHSGIIDETGGSHGVRDLNLLRSLDDLPKQAVYGKELYPTLFDKAAVYVRNVIHSHPFIDGNKRTAMAAADVFLQLNGRRINVRKGGVEKFALDIIAKRLDLEAISAWLKKHSRKI